MTLTHKKQRYITIRLYLFLVLACLSPSLAEAQFKVGVSVPLSGPVATFGKAIQNGIALAQEDSATKATGSCSYLFEDNKYSATEAVSGFRRLTDSENVNLTYVFGGPTSEAIAPLADRSKSALITDMIDQALAEGRNYVVRYANRREEYTDVLVRHLQKQHVRTIRYLDVENHYIKNFTAGLSESAKGKIDLERAGTVNPDNVNLSEVVPLFLGKKFDALGVFLLPGQISSFLRKSGPFSGQKLIVGTDFFESPEEALAANGAMNGAVYANMVVNGDFRDRYLRKFGNDAAIKFGAEGYDVATLLGELFCKSPGNTARGMDVIKTLMSASPREGMQGFTEFVETKKGDKYFRSPVRVLRIDADKFVPVD